MLLPHIGRIICAAVKCFVLVCIAVRLTAESIFNWDTSDSPTFVSCNHLPHLHSSRPECNCSESYSILMWLIWVISSIFSLFFQIQKHRDILSEIHDLEIQLQTASENVNKSQLEEDKATDDDEDALDAFMIQLSTPAADRKLVTRIKVTILILVSFSMHNQPFSN